MKKETLTIVFLGLLCVLAGFACVVIQTRLAASVNAAGRVASAGDDGGGSKPFSYRPLGDDGGATKPFTTDSGVD